MRAPVAKKDELVDRDGGSSLVETGAAVDFGVERVELEPREVDELEALPLTNASDREARGKKGFGD